VTSTWVRVVVIEHGRQPDPTPPGGHVDGVCVVTTDGSESLDRYGRELAQRLPVADLAVSIAGTSIDTLGASWFTGRALRAMACDVRLMRTLRDAPDILHITHHHMARYAAKAARPFILTAHDVIRWMDMNRTDPLISPPRARDARGLRRDYAAFTEAAAIIAVSQLTKNDLVKHLHLDPSRIFVVHEAVDTDRFRPSGSRPVLDPYVLFVGSEQPRKNLDVLLRAFAQVKQHARFRRLRLLKVGTPGSAEARFRDHTLRTVSELDLNDDVIFTGYVSDADLPSYYTHAECFVLPSRYEGFGLPPLEAMACGCPVISSNAGSLPEVVGEAALQVDPTDAQALAEAMCQVLDNPSLATALSRRGTRRVGDFSWDKVVHETLDVYRRVLEGNVPGSAESQVAATA
jgi:glycosyltransferase involved in cell wall biosynthesis